MTDWQRYHRPDGLVESGDTFTINGTGDIAPVVEGWTIERLLIGTSLSLIVVIIIAVLFITPVYRRNANGAVPPASMEDGRVLAAKSVVMGGVTFAVGLAAAGIAVLVGRGMFLSNGVPLLPVTLPITIRVILGTAALLAVAAVFALALGALFRRAIPAIAVALLAIILPYGLALAAVPSQAAAQPLLQFTPAAGFAIQQSIPEYPQVVGPYIPLVGFFPLAPWVGFAVLCGYTILALALAFWVLRRRAA